MCCWIFWHSQQELSYIFVSWLPTDTISLRRVVCLWRFCISKKTSNPNASDLRTSGQSDSRLPVPSCAQIPGTQSHGQVWRRVRYDHRFDRLFAHCTMLGPQGADSKQKMPCGCNRASSCSWVRNNEIVGHIWLLTGQVLVCGFAVSMWFFQWKKTAQTCVILGQNSFLLVCSFNFLAFLKKREKYKTHAMMGFIGIRQPVHVAQKNWRWTSKEWLTTIFTYWYSGF